MHLALYAHPFDLDALAAHGGLQRLADLGFREVAMATSYHDGRWLMPWHPDGRVRFLEDGTVHFRPSGDYGVLQPKPSRCVPTSGPSPLERLCTDAPQHGLAVRAWNVFTHNTRLGTLHPELTVQNAFGDRYSYALCPAQPEVQHYVGAMTRDLVAHRGLATIEFEALGWMGWKHSSHHDKSSFAPSGLLDLALSACFCVACEDAMRVAGHDPAATRAGARAVVDEHVTNGDSMAPVAVGAEARWVEAVLAVRTGVVGALADLVRGAAGGKARAVQVHPNAWFTGSQLAAPLASAFPPADERVFTCYGEGPDAIARLLAAANAPPLLGSPRRVCIWPKAPQFTGDQDLAKLRDLLRKHGVEALAVYHLGLLPWRTIERVAKAFTA
jgi:hypothetical protein